MKTLTFSLVAGYPNKMSEPEMQNKIESMIKEVCNNLRQLSGVSVEFANPVWYVDENGNKDQVRAKFWVTKQGRKTTWDDIMGEVNKTYGPHYKFV